MFIYNLFTIKLTEEKQVLTCHAVSEVPIYTWRIMLVMNSAKWVETSCCRSLMTWCDNKQGLEKLEGENWLSIGVLWPPHVHSHTYEHTFSHIITTTIRNWIIKLCWDFITLYSPDCPDTHTVDQASLKLRAVCVCLMSANIKGACHNCYHRLQSPPKSNKETESCL